MKNRGKSRISLIAITKRSFLHNENNKNDSVFTWRNHLQKTEPPHLKICVVIVNHFQRN